jgi:tight adherence protein C
MSLALLIPILVLLIFLLIGAGIYYSMSLPDLQRRLDAIREDSTLTMEERLRRPFMERTFLPLLDGIAKRVKRFTKQDRMDKLQQKLVQAGMFPRFTASRYDGLCWLVGAGMMLALPVLNLLASLAGSVGTEQGASGVPGEVFSLESVLIYLVAFLIGHFMPVVYLSKQIRARQTVILRALPSAIDLISISAEAGMGFDQALNYVRRQTAGPLAEEFGITLNEIRLGKPRIEALNNLSFRTGVDDVKVFVSAVTQSFQLGTSIVETLRVQADSIRLKQRQRAQEQAMKAPVKMLFPLVFFIFPALLVVILGPAAITILSSGMF